MVTCPLARHRIPQIRFLYIGSHVCSALLSDAPSRLRPCASLSLHLHQVVKRTFTSKLSNMLGTHRHRGSGRPLAPATPPYMRVRIRRFDKLVPPMDWQAECSRFGDAVRVSLLGSASIAASPRRAHQRPAKAGWRVHYPHRDPSTTGPSYRSGLPHLCEYYALC